MNQGAISDKLIKELKLNEYFSPTISLDHISPSSLDLPLLEERYRIARMSLPQKGVPVRQMLSHIGATPHTTSNLMEKGVKYLVSLGTITKVLPEDIHVHISPKSSTGRVDIHVKLLADGVSKYDTIPAGFTGEIWLLIIPQSFPVIVAPGEVLTQARFYKGSAVLTLSEIEELIDNGLVKDKQYNRMGKDTVIVNRHGHVTMTLDLDLSVPGYVCRGTDEIIDLSKRNFYEWADFFEKVEVKNGGLILEPNAFYILSTKEVLDIPGDIAGEMLVSQYKFGEFRAHYAGFFDPGFRAFGTLEIRSTEQLFVYDGYPITEMVFEKLSTPAEILYGDKPNVNYQGQVGPTLAKYFKKD